MAVHAQDLDDAILGPIAISCSAGPAAYANAADSLQAILEKRS